MKDTKIFLQARNEGALIGQCLAALVPQETAYSFEIVVLDSESSDDTVARAKQYGARVSSIPARLFTYSSALHFGAQVAHTRYFLLLSISAPSR